MLATGNCGSSPCIAYNEDPLGWDGLGIGRMITFLAIDGFIFIIVLLMVELQLWEKFKEFCCSSLMPVIPMALPSMLRLHRDNTCCTICELYLLTFLLDFVADAENGAVVPAEDDDVARERDLLHSKPVAALQMDNNLVIK